MDRFQDWQTRLAAYFEESKSKPFAYGQIDCALFCAGAVKAMTGKDFARGFRGYSNEIGGFRKLKKKGFKDHIDFCDRTLPKSNASGLNAGDLAVIQEGDDQALGVVQGRGIYVMWEDGVGFLPKSRAVRGYKI